MEVLLALVIGILYASGIYLLLRRSIVKIVIGLGLLANGANLLIFTAAGLLRGRPPLVGDEAQALAVPYADPIPQALILTAIVISFGVMAFTLVLVKRAHQTEGQDDLDQLRSTE